MIKFTNAQARRHYSYHYFHNYRGYLVDSAVASIGTGDTLNLQYAPAPLPRPVPSPSVSKLPLQPVAPKKMPAPKKTPLPKPAAVPVPAPATPLIPVPALQTRPTIPLIPVAPETLPQEWRGNNDTSIQHTGQIVVKTDEQWIHFWAEHHPDEAAPEVDFSRNMVVGVFLGERPADNFEITITGVRPEGNALIVDYLQIDPPVGTYQVGKNSFPL